MDYDLRICEDIDDLSRRAAEAVASAINDAIRTNGRCSIALAGGNTPRPTYELLASRFNERIPWTRVHVFWGDERFVPAGDPRRNDTMARKALLDRVPCPPPNIHGVPAEATTAVEAAAQYEAALRNHFSTEWPVFDLVILGLGEDGHTASLFPGSPAVEERTRWAVAVEVPADPPVRISLTLPVFNHASLTYFLVTGPNKAPALGLVLDRKNGERWPAARIHPSGRVVWWVDREAARALESARQP